MRKKKNAKDKERERERGLEECDRKELISEGKGRQKGMNVDKGKKDFVCGEMH
jgi:hypothetical protein